MINIIVTFLKVLLVMLPFIGMSLTIKKINLAKQNRSKQFVMIAVTFVYVVLAMIFLDKINQWLMLFIRFIPSLISGVAQLLSFLPGLSDLLSDFALSSASFLRNNNMNFWIFFISNTVIMGVYMAIKPIILAIVNKAVKPDGKLHTTVSGICYEFFSEKSTWCIKENFVDVRSMFKVFFYSTIVISCLLMLISRQLYFGGLIRTIFYPVFGILMVGEIYFYLDGLTKREYTEDILGEDEDAYRTVNYSLLRKFLRSVFRDKLLTENTSINNALAYEITTDEVIRELEKSEDPKVVTFASFADALNKTGFQIDHNYLHSSLDMLNGKSVLFNNPFYNDLIPYAFYPMNRELLKHKKVLVVLGRHSMEDDIVQWLQKGIESVTNIPFLWKIGVLTAETQDLDIGIITRSDVINMQLQNANSDFLEQVGFFVIIEPSKLLSTAQIGLNLLVKKCKSNPDNQIVYCMCDKNCDGLVDAMSHALLTSITEVSATKKHLGTSSYMCWEADREYLHHRLVPNISRYLGMGTELSFAALKNQVSKTKWYGGEAFPVTDIRWIDRQYYYDLTKYASLPASQDVIDDVFYTSPNFWSAEIEKNNYFTVEDEANNMFEILRDFSTRTTEQGFINVISSEYLLKDYMAENSAIFEADAKAIPYIVADYTRSNRNAILRLVLMMSTYPVSSETLENELSLLGINVYTLKKQLWFELYKCYCSTLEISELSDTYDVAVQEVYSRKLNIDDESWEHTLIKSKESFNTKLGRLETVYYISDSNFFKVCVSELRSAGYVAEDEKGQRHYIGSELCGHIYQKYLPGQFFTFGGKYYEMQYLTAGGQVLVRRAADHINGRPTYRQIREYTIHGTRACERIGSQKDISGMKVCKEFADISVETPGYYRMERYNDFETSKKVSFEGNSGTIPKRNYRNKEVLRIELPSLDGKLTDNVRYTVTLLFNEILRTIFAENQAYICAVTDCSFIENNDKPNPLTYSVKFEDTTEPNNSIYIVEDSQLDLGLTVAVERNLERILGIIEDYLMWHLEAVEESLLPPAPPEPPVTFTQNVESPEDGEDDENGKKKGCMAKVLDIFRGKKKKPEEEQETEENPEDTPEEIEEETEPQEIEETEAEASEEPSETSPEDVIPEDEADSYEDDLTPTPDYPGEGFEEDDTSAPTVNAEDNVYTESEAEDKTEAPDTDEYASSKDIEKEEESAGIFSQRKPYHERYFMLYGDSGERPYMDLTGACEYLKLLGMEHNALRQARECKNIAQMVEASFKPGKPDARYCDFCGTEIFGVEYETLSDGRDRCLHCSRTAIKTGEEFRKIFEDVKRNMEAFFGIRINAGIKVQMVNSRTLHKRLGKAFVATPANDGRVLGVAISDKNGYTLLVENGSPRMASMLTMAHELTHIWQYINWKDKDIKKKYGKAMRLEIYEGMAKWVEIQYAYLINEPAVAKREEIITSYRDDEYGRGFLRYRANYPFSLGTVITKPTPFMNVKTPLDPAFCGAITVKLPTTGINPGDVKEQNKEKEPPKPRESEEITPKPFVTHERNPYEVSYFSYNQLDEPEKAVYEELLERICNFQTNATTFASPVTNAQIQKIIDAVQRDHPEIFWFQHGASFTYDGDTQLVRSLNLTYCMTPEEVELRKPQIEAQAEEILSSVDDTMGDYEATLKIYENLIKLVDYDTIGLERQKRTRTNPDEPDDLRSIYGVFVNHKAVCAGYAKAMQYLLTKCGIECTFVNSDTHAWNLVKLEGDYYHLDVTWGDGTDTKKDKNMAEAINYDLFCVTTEEILRLPMHTPTSDQLLPICTATGCNYHRRNGLYFDTFDYDVIRKTVTAQLVEGKTYLTLKFSSKEALEDASAQLVTGGKFREILKLANLKPEVRVKTDFMYSVHGDRQVIAFITEKL